MPLVLAKCPECGGTIKVESEKKLGVCENCGEPFVVEDAINNFTNYYTNNYITNNNTTHNYGDGAVVNVYEDKNKDFVIEAGVLKEYHGASVDVVIPDGVVEIKDDSFKGLKIKSVVIPSDVISIGSAFYHNSVFSGCMNLTSIIVDENNNKYSSVDGILFNKDRTDLICYPSKKAESQYIIPDSVTSIYAKAFSGCTNLTSVTIPDSVTSIGNSAFDGCSNLTSVTIPDSVTSIGNSAFSSCRNLTSVTIPDSVTSIGRWAFKN